MMKKYIEPEIEVLEITECVYCSPQSDSDGPTTETYEGTEGDTISNEPVESTSSATDNTSETTPVEAPAEEELAETE